MPLADSIPVPGSIKACPLVGLTTPERLRLKEARPW